MIGKRLLLPIFSSLVLVSCGGAGTSSGKMTDESAGEVIEYYNKTLEVFRNGYSTDKAGDVVEYMNNKGRAHIAPIVILSRMYDDSTEMTAPGNRFGKSAGDSLTMLFREYYASCKKIDDNYEAFKAYKKAEDFKDDDWAKGKQLAQEAGEAADRIVDVKTEILNIISGPADAAEMALMEGNPLKEHILLAKKIFAQMESMMQTVSEEQVNEQSLTTAYNTLEQLVKEGRDLPKVKDMDTEMRHYGECLDEVDSFLGVVRKAQRNGKYTQSVLSDMDTEYADAVHDYNYFVD